MGTPDAPLFCAAGVSCYVLDNGKRVITKRSMVAALSDGREAGDLGQYIERLPNGSALLSTGTNIEFQLPTNGTAHGIEASTIARMLKLYAEAWGAGALRANQIPVAQRADVRDFLDVVLMEAKPTRRCPVVRSAAEKLNNAIRSCGMLTSAVDAPGRVIDYLRNREHHFTQVWHLYFGVWAGGVQPVDVRRLKPEVIEVEVAPAANNDAPRSPEPEAFFFGEFNVRTAGTPERPLFCIGDVCSAIGLSNVSQACERVDPEDIEIIDSAKKGSQSVLYNGPNANAYVTESGLYDLILGSNKHRAFKRWVTREVLPTIRKTGRYERPGTTPQLPSSSVDASMLATLNNMSAAMKIRDERDLVREKLELLRLTNEAERKAQAPVPAPESKPRAKAKGENPSMITMP